MALLGTLREGQLILRGVDKAASETDEWPCKLSVYRAIPILRVPGGCGSSRIADDVRPASSND